MGRYRRNRMRMSGERVIPEQPFRPFRSVHFSPPSPAAPAVPPYLLDCITESASAKHSANLRDAAGAAGPLIASSGNKARRKPLVIKSFIFCPGSEA